MSDINLALGSEQL